MAKLGRGIYYRKKEKRYVGKCHAGRDETGKIIYAYVYSKSYAEVVQKLEDKRLQVSDQREMRVHKDGSLAAWLVYFVTAFVNIGVKQSTRATYLSQIRNHIIPALGDIKVCALTTEQVQDFVRTLENRGLSPTSIKNIYAFLSRALAKAESRNMMLVNPCNNILLPEVVPKQTKPLTRDEQGAIEKSGELAVTLSLFTGMRLGEISALRIENIDLQNGTLCVDATMQRISLPYSISGRKTEVVITAPKSKKSFRTIPLPECIVQTLKEHITADKGFLLTNSEEYAEPRTIQNRFYRLLDVCGIEHTNFHNLRHTFATRCLESGMDIKTLSEVLGHANATITMNIYCHSCDEHKKECMNKLKFMGAA